MLTAAGTGMPPVIKPRVASRPGMDILRAMSDPLLFGPHFEGQSWAHWQAYLAALFGLPMDEPTQALFRHHTHRQTPPSEPFKESALICGRRAGKSRVMALVAVYLACFRDYKPYLAPGEVATVSVIAADRRQARTIMRYISGAMNEIKLLKSVIKEEQVESLTLKTNVVIEIATASFRVTRGYTYAAVVCDEIAYWRSEAHSAAPDTEIVAALRPGMASIPGAMLIMASSPYAKRGVLWDTYKRHYGQDDARVLVWKSTSLEANPLLDPQVIQEAYESDPSAASAEFGAEFRSDIAAYIDRAVVENVTMLGRHELPPMSGQQYRAYVDPAGGSGQDSYCLAIAHPERVGVGPDAVTTAVLDVVREYRPPFSPDAVSAEIAELVSKYRCRTVTGDRYAGEFPRELFQKRNIEYKLSDRPASDIFRDSLPLFNSGRVELLDNTRLANQLIALERRSARSGRDSIGHPVGGHDDLAVSVCGALLLCTNDLMSDVIARFKALAS